MIAGRSRLPTGPRRDEISSLDHLRLQHLTWSPVVETSWQPRGPSDRSSLLPSWGNSECLSHWVVTYLCQIEGARCPRTRPRIRSPNPKTRMNPSPGNKMLPPAGSTHIKSCAKRGQGIRRFSGIVFNGKGKNCIARITYPITHWIHIDFHLKPWRRGRWLRDWIWSWWWGVWNSRPVFVTGGRYSHCMYKALEAVCFSLIYSKINHPSIFK